MITQGTKHLEGEGGQFTQPPTLRGRRGGPWGCASEQLKQRDGRAIGRQEGGRIGCGGGGGKLENLKKKPKNTLLTDNTRGLLTLTTKQAKPRPAASAAPHPITQRKG